MSHVISRNTNQIVLLKVDMTQTIPWYNANKD